MASDGHDIGEDSCEFPLSHFHRLYYSTYSDPKDRDQEHRAVILQFFEYLVDRWSGCRASAMHSTKRAGGGTRFVVARAASQSTRQQRFHDYRLVQKKGPVLISTSQAQRGRTFSQLSSFFSLDPVVHLNICFSSFFGAIIYVR